MSSAVFAQQDSSTCLSKSVKLELRSTNQKNNAWLLLGGGSALVLAGNLIGNRNTSSFSAAGAGVIMGGLGVGCMLGSIPVFMAASRNKRRAAAMIALNVEQLPVICNRYIYTPPYTTLKLTLPVTELFGR